MATIASQQTMSGHQRRRIKKTKTLERRLRRKEWWRQTNENIRETITTDENMFNSLREFVESNKYYIYIVLIKSTFIDLLKEKRRDQEDEDDDEEERRTKFIHEIGMVYVKTVHIHSKKDYQEEEDS